MSIIIKGGASNNLADINSSGSLKVVPEVNARLNPNNVGAVKFFSENDDGQSTGIPYLLSPETDDDYRLRTAAEYMFDTETFNYAAQNTGKYSYATTTVTNTWTAAGLTTNGGSSTATGGATISSYAEFPIMGTSQIYLEFEGGFSAQPVSNILVDFGLFRKNAASPYAPTDGVFFRLTSAGLQGVINYNTSETSTPVFNFTYENSHKYQFIIVVNQREVEFWIDNVLYGTIETPTGNSQPCLSATLPFSVRHAHSSTTSGVLQFILNNYTLTIGGTISHKSLGEITNACYGSYQGLSGGTMGSLAVYTNSTAPTAAVPSNTALTANLPAGLGGQAWETFTAGLAQGTDGILMSYQIPAGTVAVQGKRLKITNIKLSSFVQTALNNSASMVNTYALAFGHTAVSLATAEAVAAKARRIVLLPELTQIFPSASAAGTLATQNNTNSEFNEPIYVNPGEFIQTTIKHVITGGPTAGVLAHNIQYVYSWE